MVVNPWNYTAIIQFVTIHALIFMSPLCFQSNQTITYIHNPPTTSTSTPKTTLDTWEHAAKRLLRRLLKYLPRFFQSSVLKSISYEYNSHNSYNIWLHGFCKTAMATCFFPYIYVSCLSAFAKLRDTQLHVVIGLIHTLEHVG